jgi:hypothetical protein
MELMQPMRPHGALEMQNNIDPFKEDSLDAITTSKSH